MGSPKRISLKLYAANPEVVDADEFVPVFQRWIQEHALEGLLIDVVGYKHVHEGPGIILIGHEGDYAYDFADNRPGLVFVQKIQPDGSLQDTLAALFRRTLTAAAKLETEVKLNGLKFNYQEARVTILDRLFAANTEEGFEVVRGELSQFFGAVYETQAVDLQSAHTDTRETLSVAVTVAESPQPVDLLKRLQPVVVS